MRMVRIDEKIQCYSIVHYMPKQYCDVVNLYIIGTPFAKWGSNS